MPKTLTLRYRPCVERLEDRSLLDGSAVFSGGVITITGTPGDDRVLINDGGNQGAAPRVRVFCDGVTKLDVSGREVIAIQFSLGAGDDDLDYNLNGPLDPSAPGGSRSVSGTLGSGRDRFSATVTGLLSASLGVSVRGGAGADDLSATLATNLLASATAAVELDGGGDRDSLAVTAAAQVALGSTLGVNLLGRQGNDDLDMDFAGDLDGRLDCQCHGGQGRDRVDADALMAPGSGLDPTGFLRPWVSPTWLVMGGGGRDKLNVNCQSQSQAQLQVQFQAQSQSQSVVVAVGGAGRDVVTTSGSNVPVTVLS